MDGIFYPPEDRAAENLKAHSEKLAREHIRREAYLEELAFEASDMIVSMYEDGVGAEEAISVISSSFFGEGLSDTGVRAPLSALKIADKVLFSELLCEKMADKGKKLKEDDFLGDKVPGQRFTYVKNIYSDEAYDVFSSEFTYPTVSYSTSFRTACETVVRGDSDYCILPAEEAGGIRIPSVYNLMALYDLKISDMTRVFGPDGNSDLRFAMLSRGYRIPPYDDGDDRYLEVRFGEGGDAGRDIFAAEMMGNRLYRMNTVTDENGIPVFSAAFRTESPDYVSYLVYLSLFSPGCTFIGIYRNIE